MLPSICQQCCLLKNIAMNNAFAIHTKHAQQTTACVACHRNYSTRIDQRCTLGLVCTSRTPQRNRRGGCFIKHVTDQVGVRAATRQRIFHLTEWSCSGTTQRRDVCEICVMTARQATKCAVFFSCGERGICVDASKSRHDAWSHRYFK